MRDSFSHPAWSPDGKAIAFLSNRSGQFHIYRTAAGVTGDTLPLIVDDAGEYNPSFSPDGRYIISRRCSKGTLAGIFFRAMISCIRRTSLTNVISVVFPRIVHPFCIVFVEFPPLLIGREPTLIKSGSVCIPCARVISRFVNGSSGKLILHVYPLLCTS